MGIVKYLLTCIFLYCLCCQVNGESTNDASSKTFAATSKPDQVITPVIPGQIVANDTIHANGKTIEPSSVPIPGKNNSSADIKPAVTTKPTEVDKPTEAPKPTEPAKPTESTTPETPKKTEAPKPAGTDTSTPKTPVTLPTSAPFPTTVTPKTTTSTQTPTTVAPSSSVSPSTKAPPAPNSTEHPATPASSTPKSRFDGPSFVGGIVLAVGLVAMGFIGFKYYKTRTDRNYHTL